MALFVIAAVYSNQRPQSHWIMTVALPTFLIEAIFYLGSVFDETRAWFSRGFGRVRSPQLQAAVLWLSALLPYLVFSLGAGTFQRNAFYLLAALCAIVAFWYAILPRRITYDIGFLIVAAAPVILRVFPRIYRAPDERIAELLGHLMWIRLGIAALLVLREWNPGPFSFWPRAREWKIGVIYYLLVLIPVALLGIGIQDVQYAPLHSAWWRVAGIAIGAFFGILWVTALSEELFFRGFLERALLNSWGSPVLAVFISALLYGSSHLWAHRFPDWRAASVAALLGIACGMAYIQTGSVRAPMVTHALVVATSRVFFKQLG